MPPTFPIFLGFIAYLTLLGLSGVIGGPMLLFRQSRPQGKVILLTAIISFPTLIVVGLTLTTLFALPVFGLGYLLYNLDLTQFLVLFICIFLTIVSISGLYHWYLGYVMIKNYVHGRPLDKQLENDRVYSMFIKRVVQYYGLDSETRNKKTAANNA
ncbi:hypothetical protein SAMN04488034_11911 [Salinimicrobium catena]|uniref:Uncharacterized protein n=1 Tax=Salinimicrobium catena TaxID=390640 RepID=A0A1H5PHN9_9FLAO|nr:hypothetical protein [Salinimicrobium catena]SDL86796.1 hypothetical protein SAMN04488140_12011 [Salinimicrobium catena]SEF13379.1 hypothetical protein SAMN04488034_11911 [Salinimicrobium catena]